MGHNHPVFFFKEGFLLQFSPQQTEALRLINDWILNPLQQVFYLAGYAGTGKTTIAKELAVHFYAAFTGKATQVLASKGCNPARTIHSLIYRTKAQSGELLREMVRDLEDKEKEPEKFAADIEKLKNSIAILKKEMQKPFFTLNHESDLQDHHLLCVDECSMVDEAMGKDILSFNSLVLVLGDPAQLPPVRGRGYFTNQPPDFTLTEIHRQARGNPILDLATIVRQGQQVPKDHPFKVKPTADLAMSADQIIVGRNRTRHAINKRVRELHGRTDPLPVRGDRVVCLRNNHDLGIMNGQLFDVEKVHDISHEDSEILLELKDGPVVSAHKAVFYGEEVPVWLKRDAEEFDYGYAITCHKSQGSQWDRVLLFDESSAFKGDAAKWLYTGITRAAKELLIV